MRIGPLVLGGMGLVLASCGASRQEVVAQLGEQYVGQKVDALVMQFGPPSNSFRMTTGDTSYEWQLAARTDAQMSGSNGFASGSAQTAFCKVRATASPAGVVTSLNTEDATGSVRREPILGIAYANKSLCAEKLGIKSRDT